MRALLLCVFAAGCVSAASPEFEVASIKPIDPNAPGTTDLHIYPGGRVVLQGLELKTLIAMAFRLSWWQISGGDSWIGKDCYDVEAKPPGNLQPPITNLRHSRFAIEDERLRQMLQALLIERFQLKFHREKTEGTVYFLEKSGKQIRLQPEKPSANTRLAEVDFAGGRWFLFGTDIPQLAKFAADYVLHVPVIDRTGLTGSFDYVQQPPLADSEGSLPDFAGSFMLLMPELGFKMEKTKGPVEVLVIDHAEKPSPN